MSQQPSGNVNLHPVLQAALRSLDVELEMELAQYRCHRAVRNFSPPIHPSQNQLDQKQVTSSGELTVASKPPESTKLTFNDFNSDNSKTAHLRTSDVSDASLLELIHSRLNPEGYLESSEALLKNLPESKPRQSKPRQFKALRVLTTWGSTSMLLLCCVAGGYLLVTHPASLSRLKQSTSMTRQPSSAPDLKLTPENSPRATGMPRPAISPDLSAEEFVKLDPPNLSRLKSSSDQKNQASSTPTKAPRTLNVKAVTSGTTSSKAPTLGQRSSVQTVPPKLPPQTRTSTKVAKTIVSTGDGYYYVLVNYTGEKVLQQVKKVVKDAYVRKFSGVSWVQVGAFDDRRSAQELVQELKRHGVTATIPKP